MKSHFFILLSLLGIMGFAWAQENPLHTGPEAQEGWKKDRPGTRRLIQYKDIPYLNAVPQTIAHQANVVGRSDKMKPSLPTGFKAEVFAEGLDRPRTIKTAPNGDIFVAESGVGIIKIFRMSEEGKVNFSASFATSLKRPFGIAFFPQDEPKYVYIAEEHQIVRYPYNGTEKPSGPKEVIIGDLPTGGHWTRDLAVSMDNSRLYYSIGSRSNVAENISALDNPPIPGMLGGNEENRAMVFTFDPEGKEVRPYAAGLRNCVSLSVQPVSGKIWCVVNERDGLGDNIPSEYATPIKEGSFYGWPWYYIGNHIDPRHQDIPSDLAGKVMDPDVLLEAHSAPLGMTFYESHHFPPDYKGSAFIALHGSWNRSILAGYKVIRLIFKNGKAIGEYEDFMTGFVLDDDRVWGRPVSVAVARDGSLLISEDGNGSIWRVTYRK